MRGVLQCRVRVRRRRDGGEGGGGKRGGKRGSVGGGMGGRLAMAGGIGMPSNLALIIDVLLVKNVAEAEHAEW